jgi:protein sidekick
MCITAAVPIMETPPQNATVVDGKDATITCRAAGAPTPNVTWIYQSMCAYMSY